MSKRRTSPSDTDGYRDVTNAFIDGVSYDGRQPNAYIDSLSIGLKTDQQVVNSNLALLNKSLSTIDDAVIA